MLAHMSFELADVKDWVNQSSIRVTRVNSTNVLDEGLRIGGLGRWMNSKVRSVKQGVYQK
jgi:hypothetical protein